MICAPPEWTPICPPQWGLSWSGRRGETQFEPHGPQPKLSALLYPDIGVELVRGRDACRPDWTIFPLSTIPWWELSWSLGRCNSTPYTPMGVKLVRGTHDSTQMHTSLSALNPDTRLNDALAPKCFQLDFCHVTARFLLSWRRYDAELFEVHLLHRLSWQPRYR